MRTGLLRGRDHVLLGAVSALAERRVAIALSRGGAEKNYEHRDPNEDACGFAWSEHAWLVAVSDGHWGSGGAEVALDRLLARHAPRWTSPSAIALADRWALEGPDVALDLHRALLSAGSPDPIGRTTLAVALVRPRDGWWATLAIGDSHVFAVDGASAREAARPARDEVYFLGDARLDRAGLERAVRCTLDHGVPRAIALATDGLSETGIGVADPAHAVAESVRAASSLATEQRPLAAARGLLDRALDAQRANAAGDNVATACVWLED